MKQNRKRAAGAASQKRGPVSRNKRASSTTHVRTSKIAIVQGNHQHLDHHLQF